MASRTRFYVSNFYLFALIENPETFKNTLVSLASADGAQSLPCPVNGLIILAGEGLNATVCSTDPDRLRQFEQDLAGHFPNQTLIFKHSETEKAPFGKLIIKIRDEIVTIGAPDLVPDGSRTFHLTPEEWDKKLKGPRTFKLIDTRNWYETKIGTFRGAIDPKIDQFTEFPTVIEEKLDVKKDEEVLIFCTGGIRCEKGILELHRRGYNKVYQLDGGILAYLEKFPNSEFQGECFVFDERVAVTQDLQPTESYSFCPHCGQPGDLKIQCKRCDMEKRICTNCAKNEISSRACSKNCAYHLRLSPDARGSHQYLWYEQQNALGHKL